MNPTRIALLVTILIAGIGLYFAGEKVGFSKAVAENNAVVAKVTQEALTEQARSQQIIQKQAYVFNKALESEKIKYERAKNATKKKSVIQNCIRGSDGLNNAILTSGTIGMLGRAINSKALPKASDSVGVAGEKNTATANDLAAYAEYSITEYNQCAIQLNACIDVLNGLK